MTENWWFAFFLFFQMKAGLLGDYFVKCDIIPLVMCPHGQELFKKALSNKTNLVVTILDKRK